MKTPLEELLWRRAGHELTAAEEAEVAARLASDPEARATAAGVAAAAELLSGMPSVEPPAALRTRIDAALARTPAPSAAPRPRLPRFAWLQALRAAPLPARFAYAAAGLVVGLGIGLLLIHRQPPDAIDVRDLSGAMGRGAAASWTLEQGAGTLRAARRDGLLSLELELAGGAPASLSVRSRDRLEPVTVAGPDGAHPAVATPDGAVVLDRIAPGRYRIEVRPTHSGTPIEVVVESQGRPLLRRTLRLEELPAP